MRWVTAKKSTAPCDIGNIWLQLTELRGGGVTHHQAGHFYADNERQVTINLVIVIGVEATDFPLGTTKKSANQIPIKNLKAKPCSSVSF